MPVVSVLGLNVRSVAFGMAVNLPPLSPSALYHWYVNVPPSITLAVTDRLALSLMYAVIFCGCRIILGFWAWVRES